MKKQKLSINEALELRAKNSKYLAKIYLLSDCREISAKEENEMLEIYHENKKIYEAILNKK